MSAITSAIVRRPDSCIVLPEPLQHLYDTHPSFDSLRDFIIALDAALQNISIDEEGRCVLAHRTMRQYGKHPSVSTQQVIIPYFVPAQPTCLWRSPISSEQASVQYLLKATQLTLTYYGYQEDARDTWDTHAQTIQVQGKNIQESTPRTLAADSDKSDLYLVIDSSSLWSIIRQAFGLAPSA